MEDKLQELYHQICDLFEEFGQEHERSVAASGNKAAGRRARKVIGEIKKIITPYKKESVAKLK